MCFSSQLNAENLPIFSQINLPNGSKGNIQDAIDQLMAITEKYQEEIETGTEFEASSHFKEYHAALKSSNEDIAAQLPDSIYQPLLKQAYETWYQRSTTSYINTYSFLIFNSKSFGAHLPEEIKDWQDDLTIRGISFIAENKNITAYNIDFYKNSLNNPERAFDLFLSVIFVYQVQYTYEENKEALGAKFSELLARVFKEIKIKDQQEQALLELSFNLNNMGILKWYKQAKVPFNFSLNAGPSIFCYSVLGLLQRHLETPEYVNEELVLEKINAFASYGANLNASCDLESLKTSLDRLVLNTPALLPIVQKIFMIFEPKT